MLTDYHLVRSHPIPSRTHRDVKFEFWTTGNLWNFWIGKLYFLGNFCFCVIRYVAFSEAVFLVKMTQELSDRYTVVKSFPAAAKRKFQIKISTLRHWNWNLIVLMEIHRSFTTPLYWNVLPTFCMRTYSTQAKLTDRSRMYSIQYIRLAITSLRIAMNRLRLVLHYSY